jgi:hypothetical protein
MISELVPANLTAKAIALGPGTLPEPIVDARSGGGILPEKLGVPCCITVRREQWCLFRELHPLAGRPASVKTGG